MKIKVRELKRINGFKKLVGREDLEFTEFAYDSRKINGGEFFLAFKTEKNDGNNFIVDALKKGASGYIGQKEVEISGKTGIIVDDTLAFLRNVFRHYILKTSGKKVAITGSTGKTTTKEFTAKLLSLKGKVFKNPKNFNSDIGVPIGFLNSFKGDEDFFVFELGMTEFGEIEENSKIIEPHVASVLNVYPVHLERMKSIENIAMAKSEIFSGLKAEGIAILNYDNKYTKTMAEGKKRLFFSTKEKKDFFGRIIKRNDAGIEFEIENERFTKRFKLKTIFTFHFLNFLSALAISSPFLNIDEIDEEFVYENFLPYRHRGEILKVEKAVIVDDSYNSNPEALKLAIEDFSKVEGKKVFVLGDMYELGDESSFYHKKLADWLYKRNIFELHLIGDDIKHTYDELQRRKGSINFKIFYYKDLNEFKNEFVKMLRKEAFFLFKASNGVGLWKLLEEVKDA